MPYMSVIVTMKREAGGMPGAGQRPGMNVVDSSGWLEYFADGAYAEFFTPAINEPRS